jgi:hypothetical protein
VVVAIEVLLIAEDNMLEVLFSLLQILFAPLHTIGVILGLSQWSLRSNPTFVACMKKIGSNSIASPLLASVLGNSASYVRQRRILLLIPSPWINFNLIS